MIILLYVDGVLAVMILVLTTCPAQGIICM